MTTYTEVHIATVGLVVELTVLRDGVAEDISSASEKLIVFKKPNGDIVSQEAVFTTDGTDGKMRYITQIEDLDVRGIWSVWAYVALADFSGSTTVERFKVVNNSEA